MKSISKLLTGIRSLFRGKSGGLSPHYDDAPMRAELLSIEQLKSHALEQARQHRITTGPGYNRLLLRLSENAAALRKSHDVLVSADAAGRRMTTADEWLLDNFYLIEQEIELAKLHLPRRYSHKLPRLTEGAYAGLPRVYSIASDLIAHLDGLLNIDAIDAFIESYQTQTALNLGELWAVPISLRLATLENLRRVAQLTAKRRLELGEGMAWAERVIREVEEDPKRLIHLLAEFADSKPDITAAFLSEFVGRLQDRGPAVSIILNWIDQVLAEESTTVTQLLQRDSHVQAAEQLSVTNSIGSLRFIGSVDWKNFVEKHSRVEQVLRRDPAGAYALQDFATRDHYRHIIEGLALRSGRSEEEVACMALECAAATPADAESQRPRHVGSHLIGGDRFAFRRLVGCRWTLRYASGLLLRRYRLFFYLGSVATTSLLIASMPALYCGIELASWHFWGMAAAALLPASSLALSLINFVVTAHVEPHPLPRLDFSEGIPDEHRTAVVVPTLFSNLETLENLLENLEIRYLANRDPNLRFILLTDFPDADSETLPGENELLEAAADRLHELNSRYPRDDGSTNFYLLHRPRRWNAWENSWIAYERKRGKLVEFNALLRGEGESAFTTRIGDIPALRDIRYVITLDSDTELPNGAARALVGGMAHPLNRPRFDPDQDRIVEGYAILQPRVSIKLTSANRSLFSRLIAGETGLDPYSREVSDVYQDLFSEGSFVGKGIYDVDAFRRALDWRFPDNLILSHDLIESCYARSGLLGYVELYEDAPHSYLGEASRQHRWMRGDWQIASWLKRRPPAHESERRGRQPISRLSQWKIFDNLRRALTAPALVLLLLLGWTWGPVDPICWSIFTLLVVGLTDLVRSITTLLRKPRQTTVRLHLRGWTNTVIRYLLHPLFILSVLPYEAWIALSAFAGSGLRCVFSRRGLLVWHLPQYARRSKLNRLHSYYLEMWPNFLAVILGLSLLLAGSASHTMAILPVVILWLSAPLTTWIISRPLQPPAPRLSDRQWRTLHQYTCRTWRYFEAFVTEGENWLPPDNFQEVPEPTVAARTSPTNIGFGLAAWLTARDFGYISTHLMVERLTATFETLDQMERFRGHLYNWYDTRTLQPLPPRYVSSVDSGNLAAVLIALRAGLNELAEAPLNINRIWPALRDTVEVIASLAEWKGSSNFLQHLQQLQLMLLTPPEDWQELVESLGAMTDISMELRQAASAETFDDARGWCDFLRRMCRDHLAVCQKMAGDLPPDATLLELAGQTRDGRSHQAARESAATLHRDLLGLAERCRILQTEMNFNFLYNHERELLSIGYDVDSRRLDPGCYDLLATEARMASFIMIAEGDAPPEHWFALSRLLAGKGGATALVSWSGSMFEYLMPALLAANWPGTLLDATIHAVIKRQKRYARQRGVPWGISESGYYATDANHIFQYRAFGVPGLGLKRGLSDDLVIAPYASMLALPFAPEAACANLRRLSAIPGVLGRYGFVEAIDYTADRIPFGKNHAIVQSYMAHHQGMSLMALSHLLLDAPMVRRFMSEPAIRASQVLLQERVPTTSPTVQPHPREAASTATPGDAESAGTRHFTTPHTWLPAVHLLSNGSYHLMVTQAGGSYSRWRGMALTRWREDVTCDNWGHFLYLRDIASNAIWSNTWQPLCVPAEKYEVDFARGHAEFRRLDYDIETKTEIFVSPEDDVEIRRITLTNHGRTERDLELTSYAELVLAPLDADLAHRAFSNLFVQTEILPCGETVLATRRKREEHEADVWYFQKLTVLNDPGQGSCETDRARFLGRNRSPANPEAMLSQPGQSRPLGQQAGAVTDPIAATRHRVKLSEEQPLCIHLISGVATTREEALALSDKYRDHHFVERAFDMAWSHSQIVSRLLNVSEAQAQAFGRLASSIIYANPRNRAPWIVVARNRTGQQGLWRFGISGDLPITLVRIADIRRIDLVNDALQAHAYWRLKGLETDLVILNEDFSGYRATLNDRIITAINASQSAGLTDKKGGVFLRRIENLTDEDLILLQSVSRVVLTDSAETFQEQVDRRYLPHRPTPDLVALHSETPEAHQPLKLPPRFMESGPGGFSEDGREYIIALESGHYTPAPWCNVIAGKRFGMVVSEGGVVYSWLDNAHEYRLTAWHNDPVSNPPSEAFYLRDEESGTYWSLTPQPTPGQHGYLCRHGFGYTTFEHRELGMESQLTLFAALEAPLRCARIRLTNHSGRHRQLSLWAFHELVMGEWRHHNLMHIHTESDAQSGMLIAHNPYNRIFPHKILFLGCSSANSLVSGDRTEFIGRNGGLSRPIALERTNLSNRTGSRYDPAASIQAPCNLAPGEELTVIFIFGAADSVEEARTLRHRYGGQAGAQVLFDEVTSHWDDTLGRVTIDIPEAPAWNLLGNGWLLYQVISSRLWGRSGFYQSGGAYGYRDQLQDAMALLHAAPELLREQILLHASRQYVEGDAQHWWHPPHGAGVRTKIVDDRLWLPQAVARYVLGTGDTAILQEEIGFLESRPLDDSEESRYEPEQFSSQKASLYEHCRRAIKISLQFGTHGLPLIGGGDWNDGLNHVGLQGQGESVWMGWFLGDTLRKFSQVAQLNRDTEFAELCMQQFNTLAVHLEEHAWDGAWYRRAYFDDGTPLGSNQNEECRIDAISQSWAAISGMARKQRVTTALASLERELIDPRDGIIKLLAPPFVQMEPDPGYIKRYPAGVRENGGQYTHAAIWTIKAFALTGQHDKAWQLSQMISPLTHARAEGGVERYRVEPYVMTADIYSSPPMNGRGGWSWYTGAAAWMYRLLLETLLGLQRHPDCLTLQPRLPDNGPDSFTITYRYRNSTYRIRARRVTTEHMLLVNGEPVPENQIPLVDDGNTYDIEVLFN